MGARRLDERERVEALLAALPILPLDADAAAIAGDLGAELRRGGRSLAMADLAIAGICLSLDVSLLTRNRAHFERVDGLRLVDIPSSDE